MSLLAYPTLLAKLRAKDYRRAFVSAGVRNSIALQIRALRKKMFGTQAALGDAIDTAPNVISRYENPDYGALSIRTLLDLAKAFNVALSVRFVTFGEFASQVEDLSDTALMVPSFDEESKQSAPPDSDTWIASTTTDVGLIMREKGIGDAPVKGNPSDTLPNRIGRYEQKPSMSGRMEERIGA